MRLDGWNLLFALFLLALASMATACTSYTTQAREEGFRMYCRAFDNIEPTSQLHRVIELERVTVHIVGRREAFDWEGARAYHAGVVGYARATNDIWIFGKIVDGQIVVNEAVLGHELMHLLNFRDAAIADPDTLSEAGL